jgi:hypothetical protein
VPHGFTYATPYTLTPGQPSPGRATLLRHPFSLPTASLVRDVSAHHPKDPHASFRLASLGSAWAELRGYGNINPLSIDYACRPRLRSRLTLGGLACPRNPWSFGGRVSHPSFATHACILTRVASTAGSLRCFPCHTTLPYPSAHLDPRRSGSSGQGRPGPKSRRAKAAATITKEGRANTRMPQLRRCA